MTQPHGFPPAGESVPATKGTKGGKGKGAAAAISPTGVHPVNTDIDLNLSQPASSAALRESSQPTGNAATSGAEASAPVGAPVAGGSAPTPFIQASEPVDAVYSLSAERTRLAHLIESPNPSPADPDYPAYLVYLERVESLDQEKATHRARGGADALVSDREAAAINRLTGLVPEDAEYMVVHTKEAYRAFTGRARDPEGNYERIVGGRKAAASLKSLWYLTGNDNPYADWALVSITDQLEEADQKFDAEIAKVEVALKKREKLGLRYSILRSKEPQNVELGFRSPYGWKIAELLVRYDYLVRMLKTLNTRAILTDAKTQKAIMDHTRLVRRLFLAPLRFEAVLLKEDVAALSRRDFLQEADAEARKRVGQIQGVFGRVPTDIMTGSVSPQHGKRRAVLTPDEMRQLRTLQAVPIDAEDDGAERGLL